MMRIILTSQGSVWKCFEILDMTATTNVMPQGAVCSFPQHVCIIMIQIWKNNISLSKNLPSDPNYSSLCSWPNGSLRCQHIALLLHCIQLWISVWCESRVTLAHKLIAHLSVFIQGVPINHTPHPQSPICKQFDEELPSGSKTLILYYIYDFSVQLLASLFFSFCLRSLSLSKISFRFFAS